MVGFLFVPTNPVFSEVLVILAYRSRLLRLTLCFANQKNTTNYHC